MRPAPHHQRPATCTSIPRSSAETQQLDGRRRDSPSTDRRLKQPVPGLYRCNTQNLRQRQRSNWNWPDMADASRKARWANCINAHSSPSSSTIRKCQGNGSSLARQRQASGKRATWNSRVFRSTHRREEEGDLAVHPVGGDTLQARTAHVRPTRALQHQPHLDTGPVKLMSGFGDNFVEAAMQAL